MANYNKSFNFRNGVQVDNDNFIVNANGLVGIGTLLPTEFLDVYGTAKVTGLVTATTLYAGIATFSKVVAIGSVTANTFYGSAAGLTGVLAIATNGWIVNSINSGIYTSFNLGIGTTNPQYSLQIGQNPSSGNGFSVDASSGNVKTTGIITASSISASLSAINLTGTIDNSILPSNISISGIITAASGFVGNLVGIASTASSITPTANITVNSINSGFSTSGISTVYDTLHIPGNIGLGTLSPNAQLHLRKSGVSSIQLTSDNSNSSIITFGRSVNLGVGASNAQFRFGNIDPAYQYSTEKSLDIVNYDTGNINFYLNPGGAGTGSYNWFKPSLGRIMTLTSSGNLGINSDSPTSTLSVGGNVLISGVATITGNITVGGISTLPSISVSGISNLSGNVAIATDTSAYSLQVGGNPTLSNGVGIGSTGNIIASNSITGKSATFTDSVNVTSGNITVSNLLTANTGKFNLSLTSDNITVAETLTVKNAGLSGIVTSNNITVYNSLSSKDGNFTGIVTSSSFKGSSVLVNSIGIGTTSILIDNYGSGVLQVFGGLRVESDGNLTIRDYGRIGINSLSPIGAIDARYASLNASYRATFYPPILTTTERNAISSAGIVTSGAIIYNSTTGNHQAYDGSSWAIIGLTGTQDINVGVITATKLIIGTSGTTITTNNGKVGIGTTNPQGILDLVSTTSPFYLPRMTNAQRDAMVGISSGAMIYNTSVNEFQKRTATAWISF